MRLQRRTMLKCLHWGLLPLVVWFTLVQPHDIRPYGPAAFMFHSVLGLIFVTMALIWTADYMARGLASRPGPKLGPRARRLHIILHKVLI